jgi:hypothetical protein
VLTEGDRRKAEASAVLAPLAQNPGVELEISTFQEAAARRPPLPANNLIARSIEVDRERIPAYPELKRFFAPASPVDQVSSDQSSQTVADHRIERFAASILNRSRHALLHVWALKHHAEEAVAPPSAARRSQVEEMIADHFFPSIAVSIPCPMGR